MKKIIHIFLLILLPVMASANVARGDVNSDGIVNGTDIQSIINFIIVSQYDEKADVNGDKTVNGTDIQDVINIILNGDSEEAYKMPVLRISFEGEVTRDMDYLNGAMQLTDTDGSVVELPARFRTRGATAKSYLMKPALNMKLCTADYAEEADSSLLGLPPVRR